MSSMRGTIPLLISAVFTFVLRTQSFTAAHTQKPSQSSPTSVVQFVKVHGKGLEGNLEGDSPDRDVAVLLPPSYATAKNRRYPVVYMLHGFTDKMGRWFGQEKFWINLPEVVDRANASGAGENDCCNAGCLYALRGQHVLDFGNYWGLGKLHFIRTCCLYRRALPDAHPSGKSWTCRSFTRGIRSLAHRYAPS